MCQHVEYGDKVVDSLPDLCALLGITDKSQLVVNPAYREDRITVDLDCCLCPVDVRATAAKLGKTVDRTENFMGWILR